MSNESDAKRLEQLWGGEFGNAYIERNRKIQPRDLFWNKIVSEFPSQRVLEVGCNIGCNLHWLAQHVPHHEIYGIDVNRLALAELRHGMPDVNAVFSHARELPFRDRWFDMVFTIGVLIHQPETTLPLVMSEIVRCSRQYVLCGEYWSDKTVEIPYRDQNGALFKRDYGRIYQELFPELQLRKQGFLGKADGFDDATWWLFERSQEREP